MKAVGCLFIFVIGLLLALVVAVANIITTLFRVGRSGRKDTGRTQGASHSWSAETRTHSSSSSSTTKSGGKEKIFADNEGEYVEFEEVKDE